jgi:protein-disulfide isomerase
MNQKIVFAVVGAILVLAFFVATLIYRNHQAATQPLVAGQYGAIAERQGAPIKGPADARVTIVEFFDPACETCRDFLPMVTSLINRYPGKVRVMMRYAPLHPGSDQVVKMLEAANQQGKFWPALELLFESQNRWTANHQSQPMRALGILNTLDIDQEQFTGDMNSEKVGSVIAQDVEDAQKMGVRATPEFFVNGQPLPSWGFEQLSQLVEETVARVY